MPKESTCQAEEKLAEQLHATNRIDNPDATLKQIRSFDLKAATRKKELVSGMTVVASPIKQAGRASKVNEGKAIKRNLRSCADDRERQILKQASTQFYFSIEAYLSQEEIDKKLVEVQMMHLQYGAKDFVLVAANETDISGYFKHIVGTTAAASKTILTTTYTPQRDVEGKRRSRLYAKKLENRLFKNDQIVIPHATNKADKARAVAIGLQLRKPWSVLDINAQPKNKIRDLLNREEGGVFVLDNHLAINKERHAEEALVDILEIIKAIAKDDEVDVYSCIAGKKRPCMTCSGRMKGLVDNFGPRPGFLWLHAAGRQSPTTFTRTCETVLTQAAHVSLDGRGKNATDYDSGSESESECEEPKKTPPKPQLFKAANAPKPLSTNTKLTQKIK